MIANVIQEEKNKISEVLINISNTINKLQFMNISDYQVSQDFKERWELKLKKLFADIDNYQKNEFPVVVLGRWNSGKSTLINAILGEEILPTANKEMTSILTKISYGNNSNIIVKFDEGKYQAIQRNEIKDYVNFRGNKYSIKVKQLNVRFNSPFLKSGLCILDTPGLSSINELNNNITFDVIPKANSVILTFSGLDVGGKDNLNLIEQVLRLNYDNLYKIVFVITKEDLLSEKDSLEAKESLRELINIVEKRLGIYLKNKIKICTVSSYMELKYKQYKNHSISEKQILNDRKLGLSHIDKIQLLHEESNFEEFYKLLDESILNSKNKKEITNNLFLMIHNILTELLENYNSTFKYLSASNNSSLKQISEVLQHRLDIEKKIREEGIKEIDKYNQTIKIFNQNSYKKTYTDKVIKNICTELCKYIDATPYEVISKNEFKELNEEINIISTNFSIIWIKEIKEKVENELQKTIQKILLIIEKNTKEINEIFESEEQNINLDINGFQLKSNATLSKFMISFASSASAGAGLFTIGNGLLPGVGGIVGSIVGGMIGFIASMIKLSSAKKSKEILKTCLNKYLFEKEGIFCSVLDKLFLHYYNAGEKLEKYLRSSLVQLTQDITNIIENYNTTKEKFSDIEKTLTHDIKSIKELVPEVNLAFSQYIKIDGLK